MFYSILAQVKHNLKTRKCKAVFAVILGFVLANYLQNVFRYAGYDVIDMYHPMKLRLLVATDNPLGFYFMQLFPFLAVIPASFVLLENRETRYEIYICSRIGKQRYHFSATISAALTTFVVFFLLTCPKPADTYYAAAAHVITDRMDNYRILCCHLFSLALYHDNNNQFSVSQDQGSCELCFCYRKSAFTRYGT